MDNQEPAVIAVATCAYCGAIRPINELEYCRPWINGTRKPGFYCAERTHPGQFLPDCACNAEASAEG